MKYLLLFYITLLMYRPDQRSKHFKYPGGLKGMIHLKRPNPKQSCDIVEIILVNLSTSPNLQELHVTTERRWTTKKLIFIACKVSAATVTSNPLRAASIGCKFQWVSHRRLGWGWLRLQQEGCCTAKRGLCCYLHILQPPTLRRPPC